ncbi:MAG: NAD(P)-dependent oxidoreductase, partial [Fusobacteriaceae bacterium]
PLTGENRYIIDEATLDKMKEGVIIINTARGELINNGALLKYLKNGKIGAAALDTIEGEVGIFHKDYRDGNFHHETLKELISMKNVMVTSHQAFYTDQAVSDMVQSALNNLYSFYTTGDAENNLITF